MSGGRRVSRRPLLIAAVAAVVIAVDQVTKTLAERHLTTGPQHLLGPLNLDLSYNTGAAFGLGRGLAPVFVAVGAVLVVLLLGFGRAARTRPTILASGLIIGGALSNLADRVLRANGGAVIDFVKLPHWPTFNVADSSIVVGVVVLILSGLRRA